MTVDLINNYEVIIKNLRASLEQDTNTIVRLNKIIKEQEINTEYIRKCFSRAFIVLGEAQWGVGRGECPVCFNNQYEGHTDECEVDKVLQL